MAHAGSKKERKSNTITTMKLHYTSANVRQNNEVTNLTSITKDLKESINQRILC